MELILIKQQHIPEVKVGDMLITTILADKITTLTNSRKVTKIQKNGVLRVECINSKCKKKECTYLKLTKYELEKLKIDNSIKESKRLGGITIL